MAIDPRKKVLGTPDVMPTAIVRPDSPPQVGGGPAVANPLSGAVASLSAPARLQPGQAAPDVNPQAAGTRFGNTLRDTRRGIVNDQVATLNTLNRAGAGIANTATYLPRAALGFTRDTTRAALGMDPSPNAGQPIGGVTAPQLAKPYIRPPVNFALTHNDVPVRDPRVATPAAAPAVAPGGATGTGGASPAATNPNFDPAADNISSSNLATAMKPSFTAPKVGAAAVTKPGIDSGTVVEGGRKLNYGAMVDGVPTFSDGSSGIKGVAGNIPRTMSDQSIASLGARAQVIPAQVSTLASDSMGGVTPTQDQMVDQRVAQIQRPITGSRPSAEQFAAADRLAIAMRDPRSAAGIAARNLAVEAQYGRGGARKAAINGLAQLTAATDQAGALAQQGENAQAITDAQGQNALDQTALQGQNALANTALENKGRLQMPRTGQQVTLADGTLGIQDPITGAITRSTLPDGSVARGQPRNPSPPIYTSAGGQAALQTLTNNILGINPLTGMIDDKSAPDGRRLPTNDEQFAAMQKAQQQLQSLGQGGGQSTSVISGPPSGAVDFLKKNPQQRAAFDQKYGAGAAARVLGS